MAAANSRLLTSAFAYGDSNPLESCVTIGEYTSANTTAGRIKIHKRVLALVPIGVGSQRGNMRQSQLFVRLT